MNSFAKEKARYVRRLEGQLERARKLANANGAYRPRLEKVISDLKSQIETARAEYYKSLNQSRQVI